MKAPSRRATSATRRQTADAYQDGVADEPHRAVVPPASRLRSALLVKTIRRIRDLFLGRAHRSYGILPFFPAGPKKSLHGRCPSATLSRIRDKVQRPPVVIVTRQGSRAAERGRPCLYRGENSRTVRRPSRRERRAGLYLHVRLPARGLRCAYKLNPGSPRPQHEERTERRWSRPKGVSYTRNAKPACGKSRQY